MNSKNNFNKIFGTCILVSIILLNSFSMKNKLKKVSPTYKNTLEIQELINDKILYLHRKEVSVEENVGLNSESEVNSYIDNLELEYSSLNYDIKKYVYSGLPLNCDYIPDGNGFYLEEEGIIYSCVALDENNINIEDGYTILTRYYIKYLAKYNEYIISEEEDIEGYENLGEYNLLDNDNIFLVEIEENGETKEEVVSLDRIKNDKNIISIIGIADKINEKNLNNDYLNLSRQK